MYNSIAMADQEFQEFDIIFQENVGEDVEGNGANYDHRKNSFSDNKKKLKRKKNKEKENSLPVNIPKNASASAPVGNSSWFHYMDSGEFDGEFTPPHVILGRRMNGKMAFSVCTGNGRTLKGRDLSQVRNSILRMTGFLES